MERLLVLGVLKRRLGRFLIREVIIKFLMGIKGEEGFFSFRESGYWIVMVLGKFIV